MSRALTHVTKIVPSLTTSGSTAMPSTQASFSTRPILEGKNNRESKSSSSSLAVPAYSSPGKIKYANFVDDLRRYNPKMKEVSRAEAQKALRQYFVNFFGREGFEDVRKAGESVAQAQTDKDKAAWARLREESLQYWQRR